jgi:2-dehydropantoate 2-reductase
VKYAIIGAGGTGGILGFYMTKADRDVTLIARGRHLAVMQEKGLAVGKRPYRRDWGCGRI